MRTIHVSEVLAHLPPQFAPLFRILVGVIVFEIDYIIYGSIFINRLATC